jgi:hypothetical protein
MVHGRGIGYADDIDFDYILDSILDNAETLIDSVERELVSDKSTKLRT